MTRRVLVTGAAGSVSRQLLPGLAGYDVRLLDRTEVPAADGAEVLVGDLTDRDLLGRAMAGVDAVVHLAADPHPDADWDSLEPSNVDGFVAVLDTAQQHGVRRVVFASSVHAMGRYEAEGRFPIDPTWAPAPCCLYGATKAFDEAVAGVYADRGPLSTVGLRLGSTVPEPTQARQLPGWLGPADLRRLVVCALEADVRHGVYPGISGSTEQRWSLETARAQLGYEPTLHSGDYADAVEDDGVRVTTCHPG